MIPPEPVPAGPTRPRSRPDPARSAVLVFGTSFAVGVVSLVNVLVTSRGLGVSGRGQVAFLLTVGGLLAHISTFGVQEANANVASGASQRTGALATNSVLLALVAGGLGSAVLLGLVHLFPALGGTAPRWLLWLVLASMPVLVLGLYLQQLIVAHYLFRLFSAGTLLTPVLQAVVNTALAMTGVLSVTTVVCTWLAGQVISAVVYAVVVHRRLGGFGRPDLALARWSLAFGAKAHVGRTLTWGSYRADQWVVGVVAGDAVLGLYNVAVAWAEVLFLLPQALTTVLRPDLVRADAPTARRQTATVVRMALLLSVPATVATVLLAPVLCVTLLGAQFAGSVTPLRILVLGCFGVIALKLYGVALVSRGRPLLDSLAVGPALLLMLGLDLLLVPVAGANGAAAASSIAYLAGGVLAAWLGMRVMGGTPRELVPRASDIGAVRALGRGFVRRLSARTGPT